MGNDLSARTQISAKAGNKVKGAKLEKGVILELQQTAGLSQCLRMQGPGHRGNLEGFHRLPTAGGREMTPTLRILGSCSWYRRMHSEGEARKRMPVLYQENLQADGLCSR